MHNAAALLLKREGYDVVGVFMKNWEEAAEDGACTAAADYEDVRRVSDAIGIPYYTVNFARAMFPIGALTKPEVRALAAKAGLANAGKKDSTGVCFIGERDFKSFLMQFYPPSQGTWWTRTPIANQGLKVARKNKAAANLWQKHGPFSAQRRIFYEAIVLYCVYILANWNNKVLYIGVTNDLERRLYEHKTSLLMALQRSMPFTNWCILKIPPMLIPQLHGESK